MNTLRWTLGVVTALVAVGFAGLAVFADGFRRSLGASENAAWKVIVPLVVMGALLASLGFPGQRALLHGVALVVLAVAIASGIVLRDSTFVGATGLVYCGCWFAYYWLAAWGTPGGASP